MRRWSTTKLSRSSYVMCCGWRRQNRLLLNATLRSKSTSKSLKRDKSSAKNTKPSANWKKNNGKRGKPSWRLTKRRSSDFGSNSSLRKSSCIHTSMIWTCARPWYFTARKLWERNRRQKNLWCSRLRKHKRKSLTSLLRARWWNLSALTSRNSKRDRRSKDANATDLASFTTKTTRNCS